MADHHTLHALGGKFSDILLWKNKIISGTILAVAFCGTFLKHEFEFLYLVSCTMVATLIFPTIIEKFMAPVGRLLGMLELSLRGTFAGRLLKKICMFMVAVLLKVVAVLLKVLPRGRPFKLLCFCIGVSALREIIWSYPLVTAICIPIISCFTCFGIIFTIIIIMEENNGIFDSFINAGQDDLCFSITVFIFISITVFAFVAIYFTFIIIIGMFGK